MAIRLTNPFSRYFTDNAALLSGGKLNFFEDDGGTTRKDTFATNALSSSAKNANPVILSSSGVMPDIFLDGAYRVTLENSAGVQLDEADNVNAGTNVATPWKIWESATTYDSGRDVIVTGSDGKYYRSTTASNQGNDPTVSPGDWSFLDMDLGTLIATSTITGDTLEATGAVSAGDNAAIGNSTANGLEGIGQGSTNDWNWFNDAKASVIRCPTGTVNPVFAGIATLAGINLGDETLDTYDEGTWTPVLSDGTNNATMNGATFGKYLRIGNRVYITCRVFISAIGSVSATGVRVTGLPFTVNASNPEPLSCGSALSLVLGTAADTVCGMFVVSQTYFQCFVWDATGGTTGMTEAEWGTVGQVNFGGWYEI